MCKIKPASFFSLHSMLDWNHPKSITIKPFMLVQPDLLVVCEPAKLDDHGCIGAPDWIIEIISPSTASHDRQVTPWKFLIPNSRNIAASLFFSALCFGSPMFRFRSLLHGKHHFAVRRLLCQCVLQLFCGVGAGYPHRGIHQPRPHRYGRTRLCLSLRIQCGGRNAGRKRAAADSGYGLCG